jgi:hypothetical protein
VKISTEGSTRVVFIFDKLVVKLPWINFSRLFKSFLKQKKERVANERVQQFHQNKLLAPFVFLFNIVLANRRECVYFKRHSKVGFLLPTTGFLFGLIVIQPRGYVLDESTWKRIHERLKTYQGVDSCLLKSENYCTWNGKVYLLDFGSHLTQKSLGEIDLRFINEPCR